MQALHIPILSPSIARPIWNHRSLQQLHVSIYLACSILLNFLIRSQSTAETGSSVAVVGACQEGAYREGACREGACRKEGDIGGRVGVGGRVGIGASCGKDAFRLFRVPLPLHRASSVVYSGGVGEWASPRQLRMRCSYCIALIIFRRWAILGVSWLFWPRGKKTSSVSVLGKAFCWRFVGRVLVEPSSAFRLFELYLEP